jgi:hypothetical protein
MRQRPKSNTWVDKIRVSQALSSWEEGGDGVRCCISIPHL